jgi:small subunit ribosomal protein S18
VTIANKLIRYNKKGKLRYYKLKSSQRIKAAKLKKIQVTVPQRAKWRIRLPKTTLNYKNVPLLRKCITVQGKILPKRRSELPAKQQRLMAQVIKRARMGDLLPFVAKFKPHLSQLADQQTTSKPYKKKSMGGGRKREHFNRIGFNPNRKNEGPNRKNEGLNRKNEGVKKEDFSKKQ